MLVNYFIKKNQKSLLVRIAQANTDNYSRSELTIIKTAHYRYGFMTYGFKTERYYWAQVMLLKSFALVFVIEFLSFLSPGV